MSKFRVYVALDVEGDSLSHATSRVEQAVITLAMGNHPNAWQYGQAMQSPARVVSAFRLPDVVTFAPPVPPDPLFTGAE